MKLGITLRLFLAVLATNVLVAVAMGASTRYSFTRDFLGYINEQGIERIDGLVPVMATAYTEHGGWNFLRGNPRQWFRLIRSRPASDESTPPQISRRPVDRTGDDTADDPEQRMIIVSDLTGVLRRITLVDAERRFVVGNPEPSLENGRETIERAIIVGGQTVGWLRLLPFQEVTSGAELRFQQQQLRSIWLIALLAVALAALVAVGLARGFLAPMKRIAQATHRLAAGHYGDRITVGGNDELGRLASDFNDLARTLERNEQMRRSFMADISHELRTPLAILRAEVEALEDGVRPLSREAVGALLKGIETLGKLVDDLNELSLADAGALNYRKSDIDLCAVLRACLQDFAERLAEHRILADAEIPETPVIVHADERRLQQLFNNLLENALRYTDAGGRIQLRLRERNGQVQIDLQDSPPGVPDEALPHLFERFYRIERSRSRAGGGAGLGLAICRNIIDAHGGSIGARSSPLGGLWVWLRLPARSP